MTAIHHIAGIDRLAAVCDGNLLLLDPESLEEWHVPGAKVAAEMFPCLIERLHFRVLFLPIEKERLCCVCVTPAFKHCLQSIAMYHPDLHENVSI